MLEKLVNFIIQHNKYKDREIIKEYLEQHNKYGTLDYAVDQAGNIIAVVRWNVDGEIWDILDFAIKEEFRNKGIARDLILRGLKRFPDGKYLRFKRGIRGDERIRVIKIDRILKRGIF